MKSTPVATALLVVLMATLCGPRVALAQVPPPDSWSRLTETAAQIVMLNDKAFESFGDEASTWVKMVAKPGSDHQKLGIAYELAWYTVNCASDKLKVTQSTLFRGDGQVYANRPDGDYRDMLAGSLGERVMLQICRDREFLRRRF